MDNNELTHWGVRGMRWGVRRYQNPDGSLTAAGKKRASDREEKAKTKAEAKAAKIAKKAAEEKAARKAAAKARKAEEEAAKKEYEENKERALKTGSATEVLKYKNDITPSQRIDALNRIRWEQDMKNISDKELATGKSKADKFFSSMDKNTNRVITVSKAYNTFANVYNAFSSLDKPMLPTIQTDNTKSNRAQRRAEKKLFNDDKGDDTSSSSNTKTGDKTKKSSTDDGPLTGKVVGKGTSRRSEPAKGPTIEAEWRSTTSSVPKNRLSIGERTVSKLKNLKPSNKQIGLGERYIAGLLEEPKR